VARGARGKREPGVQVTTGLRARRAIGARLARTVVAGSWSDRAHTDQGAVPQGFPLPKTGQPGQALFWIQVPLFFDPPARCPGFVGFAGKSLFMNVSSARSPATLGMFPAKEFKLANFWDANHRQRLSSGFAFHSLVLGGVARMITLAPRAASTESLGITGRTGSHPVVHLRILSSLFTVFSFSKYLD
jgi:hypothetical protein